MSPRCLLVLISCSSGLCAAQDTFDPTTRTPLIYVIDYQTSNRPADESIGAYAQAPPDVLHLSIVMNWNFRHGPVAAMGDQDCHDRAMESRQLLPPDAVVERAADIRKFVSRLHDAGVRKVVPYICLTTMVGDHERRRGFWRFYDHWEDYTKIGLYAKPKTDPFTWNQQLPDGSPKYFYPHDIAFFLPLYRYAASPTHPEWTRWMRFVTQDVGNTGMDGVFVDNANLCRDFGPHAQKAFEARIHQRYSADQIVDLFAGMPRMSDKAGSLATFESRMLWHDLIRGYLHMMREAGEAVRKPFVVMPNAAQHRESTIEFGYADCDLVMFERSRGTVPGRSATSIIGPFQQVRYRDNLFAYAYTFGVGARVRALVYTGEGRPVERYGYNRNAALLAHAEAAAFGGGGSARSPGTVRFPELNDVQNLYHRHYAQHRELYDGKRTLPQAAVVCFGTQWFYGHAGHVPAAKAALDALLEEHVLADVLTMPGCFKENLSRYRLLVLPDLQYLSDEHVRAFEDFERAGGKLLVYAEPGRYDEFMRKRRANPLQRLAVEPAFSYESLRAKLKQCEDAIQPVIEPRGIGDARERWAVKASAYVDDVRKPRQVILHILNYNVQLGRGVDRIVRVPEVAVRLPVPKGMKPTRVTILRVEGEREERLEPTLARGHAMFDIKDVGIHTICVVR